MSVRPWFSEHHDGDGWIGATVYFHVQQTELGGLVTEKAHWHRSIPSRPGSVVWCRCAEAWSQPLPKVLSPLDVEPLTARAARVLSRARGLYLLHHVDEVPQREVASGHALDALAECNFGIVRMQGETDAALRARLNARLAP